MARHDGVLSSDEYVKATNSPLGWSSEPYELCANPGGACWQRGGRLPSSSSSRARTARCCDAVPFAFCCRGAAAQRRSPPPPHSSRARAGCGLCYYVTLCPCAAAEDVARFARADGAAARPVWLTCVCPCLGPCLYWPADRKRLAAKLHTTTHWRARAMFACGCATCLIFQELNHIKAHECVINARQCASLEPQRPTYHAPHNP